MKSRLVLLCAGAVFLGLAGAALAEESGSPSGGASGDAPREASPTDKSYSPGNPAPNDEIGDHPSSADDKRGYDSDDSH